MKHYKSKSLAYLGKDRNCAATRCAYNKPQLTEIHTQVK